MAFILLTLRSAYTTDGVPQIGTLNPYVRVEAETMNAQSGIETEACSEGGMDVTEISDGDWIRVRGVDFGTAGAKTFVARVASGSAGGSIELRLGSRTGTLIGTCAVPSTGGAKTWANTACEVSGATGVKDLYLVFTKGGFNFDYWQFAGGDTDAGATTGSAGNSGAGGGAPADGGSVGAAGKAGKRGAGEQGGTSVRDAGQEGSIARSGRAGAVGSGGSAAAGTSEGTSGASGAGTARGGSNGTAGGSGGSTQSLAGGGAGDGIPSGKTAGGGSGGASGQATPSRGGCFMRLGERPDGRRLRLSGRHCRVNSTPKARSLGVSAGVSLTLSRDSRSPCRRRHRSARFRGLVQSLLMQLGKRRADAGSAGLQPRPILGTTRTPADVFVEPLRVVARKLPRAAQEQVLFDWAIS